MLILLLHSGILLVSISSKRTLRICGHLFLRGNFREGTFDVCLLHLYCMVNWLLVMGVIVACQVACLSLECPRSISHLQGPLLGARRGQFRLQLKLELDSLA